MRSEVCEVVYQAALKNRDIFFLTGDLDHGSVQNFKKNIPAQHINVGMAEQNLIGIAAGLALSGKKVFVLSIIPFATMRCFEQIRNDVCYQNVDVTVIGDGGGYFYGRSGSTHHATEDISIMRALPNMKIVAPADSEQARLLAQKLILMRGPFYLRLGGKTTPRIEELWANEQDDVEIGKGQIVRPGFDITIFSYSVILREALLAAEILAESKISVEVINLHTLKPIDNELIRNRAKCRKAIYTLEEHSVIGGLGSAVSEIICPLLYAYPLIFQSFGVNDCFIRTIGLRQYLWQISGLTGQQIAKKIADSLQHT